MSRFVHLQVHSHYSMMRGTSSIETLCKAAVENGSRALALTDVNGLYGAVRFWNLAQQAGLEPILGVDVRPSAIVSRDPGTARESGPLDASGEERAVLLVRSPEGYARLCTLLSRLHLDPHSFSLREELQSERSGLVVLTPSLSLAAELTRRCDGFALRPLAPDGEAADVYLAMEPGRRDPAILRAARRLGVPPVAVNDVTFARPDEFTRHRLLRAIDGNTTLARVQPSELAARDAWLCGADGMRHRFPHCPEALENTACIAAACRAGLPNPPWGRLVMPRYGDLEPADAAALLRARCEEGARRRYGTLANGTLRLDVRARIEHEMEIITAKKFAVIFLIVDDIVRQSPRTCGRGSAAASLVAYCLGITHVDPLAHQLYFERFLNPARKDPPDIDVDFCWDERDDILEYVFRAYGEEHTAMIANHIGFRTRAAVREVAKVYGLPAGEIARVTRRLAHTWHGDAAATVRTHPMFRGLDLPHPWPEILTHATALEGTPRHLSVHCGGVLIVPDRIDRYVPIERAAKGVRIIQWEKDQAEEAGLVKIDLLGNRSLSVVRDCIAAVNASHVNSHGAPGSSPRRDRTAAALLGGGNCERNSTVQQLPQEPGRPRVERPCLSAPGTRDTGGARGRGERRRRLRATVSRDMGAVRLLPPPASEEAAPRGAPLAFERLEPLTDPATCDLIRRGDTMGVFYVESPAMRQLQQKTHQGDFEHLVIHSSIIRPAANEYIREYIRRLRGSAYTSLHPILEEILQETYGVMVYQEDVSRIAMRMGGFDAGAADGLRKVLSKKWAGHRIEDYRRRFFAGALERNVPKATIQRVWDMILSFSGYSFCKPHSASYALLSFKSAFFKAHYPAEFMAAVISNQGGYYSTFAYVSEARRMGLRVLPPDINTSERAYTGRGSDLRIGLMQVQALKQETLDKLLTERERGGSFCSFGDFLRRVDPHPSDAARLVRCGAFDSVAQDVSRPALLWQLKAWEARRRPGTLFEPDLPSLPHPPQYDERRLLCDEVETLGFLASRHPLTLYRSAMKRWRSVAGHHLARHTGKEITTVGWLVTGKIVNTRGGEPMEFLSFEDTTAIYETTFFPEAYARFCSLLTRSRPFVLRGKVEEDFGAVTLTVKDARPLVPERAEDSARRLETALALRP